MPGLVNWFVGAAAVSIVVVFALYWAFRQGRKNQKVKNSQEVINSVKRSKEARDDPDLRDRAKRVYRRSDK